MNVSASALRVSALLIVLGSLPAAICAAQGLPQGLPGTASARLSALDADGDGLLSRYEYDSDAALAAMDGDHDERISASEMQSFLGSEEDGAESASYRISVVDQDGDGELSDAELRRGLGMRFTHLDSNKDGNVDLAELEAGFGIPMVR